MAGLRRRRVRRLAVDRDLEVQHAVVGGDDRIGEAGGDAEVRLHDLLVEQPFRADQSAGFLVEGEVQLDRALADCSATDCEREEREGVGGEVGLRDRHAAPVHDAVDHLGAERRMRPSFAGRDDVAMRVQRDHRPVAEAPARRRGWLRRSCRPRARGPPARYAARP